MEGAYQLGRGEARNGRSTDALLSAYRDRRPRRLAGDVRDAPCAAGVDADTLAGFAELVFAYIDELSAASVAGHTDELATTGRVRAAAARAVGRRPARRLADRARAREAAERADWMPPTTLTAVIVPEAQARSVLGALPGATLQAVDRATCRTARALLLVPDAHGRRRAGLLKRAGRARGGRRPGTSVAGRCGRRTTGRCARMRAGLSGDTEDHLTRLVLTADPEALADLRARALAPLADLRPAVAEKLTDTLRSWLLHHGRREDVAAALFVHPQTVRYRMDQLRDLYGDSLDDPDTVLELTIALSA